MERHDGVRIILGLFDAMKPHRFKCKSCNMHPISQQSGFTHFRSSMRLPEPYLSQAQQQHCCGSRMSKLEDVFDVNNIYVLYIASILLFVNIWQKKFCLLLRLNNMCWDVYEQQFVHYMLKLTYWNVVASKSKSLNYYSCQQHWG